MRLGKSAALIGLKKILKDQEAQSPYLEEAIAKSLSKSEERRKQLQAVLTPMELSLLALGKEAVRVHLNDEQVAAIEQIGEKVEGAEEELENLLETIQKSLKNAQDSSELILAMCAGMTKAQMYSVGSSGMSVVTQDGKKELDGEPPEEIAKYLTKYGRENCRCVNCEREYEACLSALVNPNLFTEPMAKLISEFNGRISNIWDFIKEIGTKTGGDNEQQ